MLFNKKAEEELLNNLAAAAKRPSTTPASPVEPAASALRKSMTALRRLSRLEWAERDEPSPLADPEAIGLLEQVAMELGKQGRVRMSRLDDTQGEASAVALDDGVVAKLRINRRCRGRCRCDRAKQDQ